MKTRRILSTLLALVMVLSSFAIVNLSVAAVEVTEVYVKQGATGDGSSESSPMGSIDSAVKKLTGDGTVYIIGSYTLASGKYQLPESEYEITYEGIDNADIRTTGQTAGIWPGSATVLKNIKIYDRDNGHFNTSGYKVTFGEGVTFHTGVLLHVGPLMTAKSTSEYEHIVFDGTIPKTSIISFGGAYSNNPAKGINGDYIIEVRQGELSKIEFGQDAGSGWFNGNSPVKVGGDVKIKVGAGATVGNVINHNANGWKHLSVAGYMHVILEEGGSIGTIDTQNTAGAADGKYFLVNVKNPSHGSVDFVLGKQGVVDIDADDGYIVKMTTDGVTTYVSDGQYPLTLGKATEIDFTNTVRLAPASLDITVNEADPANGLWNDVVLSASNSSDVLDAYEVTWSIDDVDTATDTPEYYKAYTYNIEISTKDNYVLRNDFGFTIEGETEYDKVNNRDGYRISGLQKTDTTVSFKYTAEKTAADTTKWYLTYYGGIGSVINPENPAPESVGYDKSSATVEIPEAALTYYTQIGYKLIGYTDGTTEYLTLPANITLTEDTTLTALWEKLPTVTVYFKDVDGTVGTTLYDKLPGDKIKIPTCAFAHIGQEFVCWNDGTNDYYPGDYYTLGDTLTDTVFTAKWQVKEGFEDATTVTYYVSESGFDDNDGSVEFPFDTIETAINEIPATMTSAIIVVDGTAEVYSLPESDKNILITGADSDAVLDLKGSFALGSPTIIENIKFNTTSSVTIYTNGKRAVFGPQITYTENSTPIDIVDGAEGAMVESIDTTIKHGVEINNYYFAGECVDDSANVGVEGTAKVVIEGADIKKFDLSPKNATSKVRIKNYPSLYIDATNIDTFTSTFSFKSTNVTGKIYLMFTDNSIPASFDSTFTRSVGSIKAKLYIIDVGADGEAEIKNTTRSIVSATYSGDKVYATQAGKTSPSDISTSREFLAQSYSKGINMIRFGEKIDSTKTIDISILAPVAGVEAKSIQPSFNSGSDKNCVVEIVSWTPEVNGRFAYDTSYTANIVITPANGVFYDKNSLVNIKVNETVIDDAVVNIDGTISVAYTFTERTSSLQPNITITYTAGIAVGDKATGTPPSPETWGHLDEISLQRCDMTFRDYYFYGWKNVETGDVYTLADTVVLDGTGDVTFEAIWKKVSTLNLPSVLLLYDLSSYANLHTPSFPAGADKIEITDGFDTLNAEMNGTLVTSKQTFEYMPYVTLEPDTTDNYVVFNHFTLDKYSMDPTEYKYMTVIYYYDSDEPVAEGEHGVCTFGSVKNLADDSIGKWMNYQVQSTQEIKANTWAYMTFDFSGALSKFGIEEDKTVIRQCHIYPFGMRPNKDFNGDKMYFDKMFFSKLPPETK